MISHYRQTFNIRHSLVGNELVDHSDVVGASSVGAASTTSSFPTKHLASMDWAKTTNEKHLSFKIWCDLYYIFYGTSVNGQRYMLTTIGLFACLFVCLHVC